MRFIPKSYFGFFVLGFLTSDLVGLLFKIPVEFYFSGIFFIGIFFFLKRWKSICFCVGFLLFPGFLILSGYCISPPDIFSIEKFEKLQSEKLQMEIQFQKEVKKKFWESEISVNGEKKKVIVYLKNWRESFIPTFSCRSEFLKIRRVEDTFGDYFVFLKKFGNYYIQLQPNKCVLLGKKSDWKLSVRTSIESLLIRGGLSDYSLEISLGLIFGDSSYLDKEFKMKAKEGGILHLFAASGLHIGIFTGFIYLIISRVSFLNYYALKILPTFAAFSYLLLLDFPVSLTRAFSFIVILSLASIFFRKTHPTDVILFSAFFIFLIDRDSYLGLSFNLSFSAVMGIFYFKNALDDIIFGKWKNFFTENFTISLSATIGTFPILMYYFHSFSFGSIFVNYILVPLTSFILPVLYLSVFVEFIGFPFLKDILWTYSDLLIRLQAKLSDSLGENLGFYKEFSKFHWFLICLFLILLVSIPLFLWLGGIGKKDRFFKTGFARSDRQKHLFVYSSAFLAIVILFFVLGYLTELDEKKPETIVQVDSAHFIVSANEKLYIGGTCKYNVFKLEKLFRDKLCKKKFSSAFVENETCLALFKKCNFSKIPESIESNDLAVMGWKNSFPATKIKNGNREMKFQTEDQSFLIFFRPDKDSLDLLSRKTKEGFGKIVVIFPYKSQDNIHDWKKNQKLLGINENWKFVSPTEL